MNRLITFEGIDGSGKTTQIRKLTERMDALDQPCVTIREPGGTRISEHIRRILLDHSFQEMSQRSEPLLFLAARAQVTAEIIRPALSAGKFVICDRYTDSTLAYQGYGRQSNVQTMRTLNDYATNHALPRITFFLDISVETSIARRSATADDRMEAGGAEYLQHVRNGYLEIAGLEKDRFAVIDGEQSADILFDIIRNRLRNIYAELRNL